MSCSRVGAHSCVRMCDLSGWAWVESQLFSGCVTSAGSLALSELPLPTPHVPEDLQCSRGKGGRVPISKVGYQGLGQEVSGDLFPCWKH